MTPRAALDCIQQCVASDRYSLHEHFTQHMDMRGLFLADVLAIVDRPRRVRLDGLDEFGRVRCLLAGKLTDGVTAELVVVLDRDDDGDWSVFITIYWHE